MLYLDGGGEKIVSDFFSLYFSVFSIINKCDLCTVRNNDHFNYMSLPVLFGGIVNLLIHTFGRAMQTAPQPLWGKIHSCWIRRKCCISFI